MGVRVTWWNTQLLHSIAVWPLPYGKYVVHSIHIDKVVDGYFLLGKEEIEMRHVLGPFIVAIYIDQIVSGICLPLIATFLRITEEPGVPVFYYH